jgi:hypothetical protein
MIFKINWRIYNDTEIVYYTIKINWKVKIELIVNYWDFISYDEALSRIKYLYTILKEKYGV